MNSSIPPATTEPEAAELLHKVDSLAATRCAECHGACCGHDLLLSIALGAAQSPHCLPCLAKSLARPPVELLDDMLAHFRRRSCYGEAWNSLSAREGACQLSRRIEVKVENAAATEFATADAAEDAAPGPLVPPPDLVVDSFWDAGDLACGDLLLQLRQRLRAMSSGAVIDVIARDRGAIEDLPAWCRLTGHSLLTGEHPRYRIRRKTD